MPWPLEDCCPLDEVEVLPPDETVLVEAVPPLEVGAGLVLAPASPVDAVVDDGAIPEVDEEVDADVVVVVVGAEAVVVVTGTVLVTLDAEEVVEIVTTGVLADGCSEVEKLVTLLGADVALVVVAEVVVVFEIVDVAVVVAVDTADVTAAAADDDCVATSVSVPS